MIGAILFLHASRTNAADSPIGIPDFSGLWSRNSLYFEPPDSGPGPVAITRRPTPTDTNPPIDYSNPILKNEASDVLKQRANVLANGLTFPTPHDQCRPEPTPYVLAVQFEMQMLQQKDHVTMTYLAGQQVRHIRLNGRHPARLSPTATGDSIGHYEGDSLVIDTLLAILCR